MAAMNKTVIFKQILIEENVHMEVSIHEDGLCVYRDMVCTSKSREQMQINRPELLLLYAILGPLRDDPNIDFYYFKTTIMDVHAMDRFNKYGPQPEDKAIKKEFSHFLQYLFWRDIYPQLPNDHRLKEES